MNFSELNLRKEILRAVSEMGFEEATPIQSQAIPVVMSGSDVIGQAQTGTGKTAAFGIPILQTVDPSNKKTQVIILSPTRELAIQVADEIRALAKYMHGVKVLPVYGGQEISKQIRSLKGGAQIIIGTPGRVMDHLRRRTIRCDHVNKIVLDEADEMLNMGFLEDMETILSALPEERQTLMFSATMPQAIQRIAANFQKDPQIVRVVKKELTVPKVTQYYYEVKPKNKLEVMCRLLDLYDPKLSVVFCNTKKQVDELVQGLQGRGYFAEGLHGDMKQASRTQVLSAFKSGSINVLIATDVAARGIDVEGVDCVFNYDLPQDNEYYIHRIGRTGRAGKSGAAYTIISGRKQFYELKNIASFIKADIARAELPGRDEIVARKAAHVNEKILSAVESGKYESCRADVQKLMESGLSAEDIAVALLGMRLSKDTKNIPEIISVPRDNGGKGGRYQKGGKVKLEISAGRSSRLAPNFVLGALVDATGMPGKSFGKIDIYDKFTTVEVPEADTEHVLDSMTGTKINGQKITIKRYEGRAERFEDDRDQRRGNYRDQRRKSSSRHGKGGRPKYENRRKG